ncbi:MAG: hypothetical protein GXP14_02980 [Gammaproteobacteria bacterium]|nr:hypothetical protein [Gammaproteobacteria bacterium]
MYPLRKTLPLVFVLTTLIFGISQLHAATMAMNNHSTLTSSEGINAYRSQSLSYTFSIMEPGWYDIYALWDESAIQQEEMSVVIAHATGKDVFNVQPSVNEGLWNHIGHWYFETRAEVKIKLPSQNESFDTNTIIKLTSTTTTVPARSIRGAKLNRKKYNKQSGSVYINNKQSGQRKNTKSTTIYSTAIKKSTGGMANAKMGVKPNNQAILSWTGPTTNSDGSFITDLAGYKIYMSTDPKSFSDNNLLIDVPTLDTLGGMQEEFIADNLKNGTYYFTITAYNSSGMESPPSQEVSKTIN